MRLEFQQPPSPPTCSKVLSCDLAAHNEGVDVVDELLSLFESVSEDVHEVWSSNVVTLLAIYTVMVIDGSS